MKAKAKWFLIWGIGLFVLFVVFTLLVKLVDVNDAHLLSIVSGKEIAMTTPIGFSKMNLGFRSLVGANKTLHKVTDFAGYACFISCAIFVGIGLYQLITRKSLKKVDPLIYVFAVFYIVVLLLYLLFDFGVIKINRRPVLFEGQSEPAWSYPSSSTMLGVCLMPTMVFGLRKYIKNNKLFYVVSGVGFALMIFVVVGRMMSGAHWLSDIMAGVILSLALDALFIYFALLFDKKNDVVEE